MAQAQQGSDGPRVTRKVTPIGVIGDVGRSFTVYEKNWICTKCKAENYARKPRCFRCRATKPEDGGGYVMDQSLQGLADGKASVWREALDPKSRHMYYYNEETGETRWDRPKEMGPAPYSTGWFGRGSAGADAEKRYVTRTKELLKRPARKQAEWDPSKVAHIEGQENYNIWYGKFMGDFKKMGKVAAESRCNVEKDSGWTSADKAREPSVFCINFARGRCPWGRKCRFYHHIPIPEDDASLEMARDIFGRERHSTHKDDMGGVGSIQSNTRTLYIGGLQRTEGQDLQEVVTRHFEEWGEVENVNVVYRLAIAFVRYRVRASAEFAKIAMEGQSLDGEELLNVRWAHDDPNPVAKNAIERANQDAVVAVMQAQGVSTEASEYQYPPEYQMPAQKRLRGAPEGMAYPDTAQQFAGDQQLLQQAGQAAAGAAPDAGAVAQQPPPQQQQQQQHYYVQPGQQQQQPWYAAYGQAAASTPAIPAPQEPSTAAAAAAATVSAVLGATALGEGEATSTAGSDQQSRKRSAPAS